MPSLFLAKKWLHDCKAERKTASNFVPTKRLLLTKRPPKGLEMAKYFFFIESDLYRQFLIRSKSIDKSKVMVMSDIGTKSMQNT